MLDSDQQKIVDLGPGCWSVLAGAGSGKSRCLLFRTARLSGTGKTLCVTFTSEATKHLRAQSQKLFPHVDTNVFSTLHSLALKFAYAHADAFPFLLSDNILAEDGVATKLVFESIGDTLNFRAFTTWVSLQKRNRVSAADAMRQAEKSTLKLDYAIGYKRYEAAKKKKGILDFDDLLTYFCDILESRPDIRVNWQYDFVLVDEAQDLSELDWRIIQLLSEKHKNVTACGDIGQSIFAFRGSSPQHLKEMDKYFPGTQTLILGSNYRSLPEIVEFGKTAYPYPEISQHFKAIRTEEGVVPTITPYSNEYREAEETINKIKKYVPEECAILARTNLALRPFEEALLDAGIEYHILGDSGFWDATEVKNVLYWLKCGTTLADSAILGAIKTPFWPVKYVKKKVVTEKIKTAIANGESAWSAVKKLPELSEFRNFVQSLFKYQYLPAEEAVRGVITDLKAIAFYKDEENLNPDRNPVANLKELSKAAGRYETVEAFLDFVRRLSYVMKNRKGVCLSTVHQSKGKEFHHVFVVSVNEGILPHSKAEDIESEKCIWFVAVSRAETTLDVSYYGNPSRFLKPWLEKEMYEEEQRQTA